jgi:hypothetical protein
VFFFTFERAFNFFDNARQQPALKGSWPRLGLSHDRFRHRSSCHRSFHGPRNFQLRAYRGLYVNSCHRINSWMSCRSVQISTLLPCCRVLFSFHRAKPHIQRKLGTAGMELAPTLQSHLVESNKRTVQHPWLETAGR